MSKSILFITDSLGCPRPEIQVSDTWIDCILSKWSCEDIRCYTYCMYGLSAMDINSNYPKYINPDLIIMQVGIVDASRRCLSRGELRVIQCIPIVRRIIRKICNEFHYAITRIRDVHYCSINKYEQIIRKIKDETGAEIVFIAIAPAGNGLVNKVYNIQYDIERYNSAVKAIPDIRFLNPYDGNVEDYILSDGHHLNLRGEEMVFKAIDKVVEKFIQGENNV